MSTALIRPITGVTAAARDVEPGKGFELVNGQLKELNVSAKSSRVGGRLYRYLDEFCDGHPGWAFPAETSFRCFRDEPERIRKPDVAFIAVDRITHEQYDSEGYLSVCPDIVAEVVSPNDLYAEVSAKRREWLQAGVRLVWVIDPDEPSVHVYPPDGSVSLLHAADTLRGDPVLPGFAVAVADLFRVPSAPARPPA